MSKTLSVALAIVEANHQWHIDHDDHDGYPVGPDNDRHIMAACKMGDGKVICAWGALGRGLSRPTEVLHMIRNAGFKPMALGFTADGLPRHPLRLGYDTPLVAM